jgi:hypothetical protein
VYDLLDKLDEPLRVAKPNKFQVAILNVRICDGDMINCVHVLDIPARHVLRTCGHLEMEPVCKADKVRNNYHAMASTLQRDGQAARCVAKRYRKVRARKCDNSENVRNTVANAIRLWTSSNIAV